jgi:hypothetical protein
MQATPSPATVLHDVVVTNEQTRVSWHAGHASIDHGRIVIRVTKRTLPPDSLFARAASTFTIAAVDGADRMRRFDGVKLLREASEVGRRVVFA